MTDANYSLYKAADKFIFARQSQVTAETDVVMAGIPFDLATSGRPGARFAPAAIRQASANFGWEGKRHPWRFSLTDHLTIADVGDLSFSHGDPKGAIDAVYNHVKSVMEQDKIPFMLGGDHLISLPAMQAVAEKHGPLAIIHIDAHTDDYSGGSEYDHGSVFYHARERGLLKDDKVIQLGIRTELGDSPFKVYSADELWLQSVPDLINDIRNVIGDSPVYLTFDIDGIDPTYAPGTGTPVSGGLTAQFILSFIRGLKGFNWVGMDLVEVSPPYDQSQITSLLAATLVNDMLHLLACKKSPELVSL